MLSIHVVDFLLNPSRDDDGHVSGFVQSNFSPVALDEGLHQAPAMRWTATAREAPAKSAR
jgi:hypothetical protein